MNKLPLSSLQNIFSLVDYLTLYQIKYTNKYFYNTINELGLSHVLDLRNVKYEKENNIIYKILQKHQNFFTKIILEFRTINDTHVFKFSDKLTHINLNYCQKITDQSLFHISKTCKKLTHLELYILPNITDKGLKVSHVYDMNKAKDEKKRRNEKWKFRGGTGRLKVCSYHSYKGWQTPNIILVLDSYGSENIVDIRKNVSNAIFISMSRVKPNSMNGQYSFTCFNYLPEYNFLEKVF